MTRHNLCPNPSAKNNATGYSGSASPARVTGLTGFPRSTGVSPSGAGFIQSPTAACLPGDQLVVSLYANAASTLGSKTVYCAFTRSTGGDDFSKTFTISVDATVRRATYSVTAPANATGVYLLFDGIGTGVNMVGVMYETGAVDGGYADGDTSGWVWDGTNGNSSSSESAGTDIPVSGTLSGTSSSSGVTSTSRPKTGTVAGTSGVSGASRTARITTGTMAGHSAVSSSTTSTRTLAGTLHGTGHLTGTSSGGDGPVDDGLGVNYDIGEIMDALAATFDGVATGDTIGGQPMTMMASAEVVGQVEPPAIVFELDDQQLDLNMGDGADQLSVTGLVLVTYADSEGAQRALWAFLSRKRTAGIFRLKAALEANQALDGLVSYAIMSTVRNIGIITYNGVDYLGAELVIEVMS